MMDVQAMTEQFHCDGYLVIPGALPPEQVARLRAGVERAFAAHCPEADCMAPRCSASGDPRCSSVDWSSRS